MKLKTLMVAILTGVVAGCISIGRGRVADQIIGTWQQAKVEGPAVAEYTNAVRFAEMTFRNDGTYQTRAGKSLATAFCASGTYTCVSSSLETLSTAGDRRRVLVHMEDKMLVITDGTNTGWMIRSKE